MRCRNTGRGENKPAGSIRSSPYLEVVASHAGVQEFIRFAAEVQPSEIVLASLVLLLACMNVTNKASIRRVPASTARHKQTYLSN
jgi:hypothetical protein